MTGVVIGRFQVAQPHEGHIALISAAAARCTRLIVLLGVSQAPLNAHDPLPFFCRADAIRAIFPQATVFPLDDQLHDLAWSATVDNLLASAGAGACVLYVGRDSSVRKYSGHWPVEVLPVDSPVSGTDIRQATDLGFSFEFRTGMVYAAQQRFPTSYQTVDIAVMDGPLVLLGRKAKDIYRRFPGGFVDPSDKSLEFAANRELKEECGSDMEVALPFAYLGSVRIQDWRYQGSVDAILTAFYRTTRTWGVARAGDDLVAVEWLPLSAARDSIHPNHFPLLSLLEAHETRFDRPDR
jgi:bifunctional NMN adenylyltransferase/nudix hydrolase